MLLFADACRPIYSFVLYLSGQIATTQSLTCNRVCLLINADTAMLSGFVLTMSLITDRSMCVFQRNIVENGELAGDSSGVLSSLWNWLQHILCTTHQRDSRVD